MPQRLDEIVERLGHADIDQRLRATRELRAELDKLEAELVAGAIGAGWSWTKIGGALGVTKQAAHSKHAKAAAVRAARPHAPPPQVPDEERSSLAGSDVREAVRLAREEAAALGQRVVGTEHLLIGMLRMHEGAAPKALRELGVSLDAARNALEPTLEVSLTDSAQTAGQRSGAAVSRLARQVLERSLREALRRRGGRLSAAGLLAEVLADRDGGAARTLARLGVPAEAVITRLGSGSQVA